MILVPHDIRMAHQEISSKLDEFFARIVSGGRKYLFDSTDLHSDEPVPEAMKGAEQQSSHWLSTSPVDYVYCLAKYTADRSKEVFTSILYLFNAYERHPTAHVLGLSCMTHCMREKAQSSATELIAGLINTHWKRRIKSKLWYITKHQR